MFIIQKIINQKIRFISMSQEIERIEAKTLYDAFKQNNEKQYLKTLEISGIVTYVGPDVYALSSVELSESKGGKSWVLCVLPFTDYFKLTKVSKKDYVIMKGNVLGFAEEYDLVVEKKCKFVEIRKKEWNLVINTILSKLIDKKISYFF